MSLIQNQKTVVNSNLQKSLSNYEDLSLPKITLEHAENLQKSEAFQVFNKSEAKSYLEENEGEILSRVIITKGDQEAVGFILSLTEQVDEIVKSEDGQETKIQKAVYADNAQNRKLGRVGQKYGGSGDSKDSKKKDSGSKESKMVADAKKIKGEYDSLKKEVKSNPSQENKTKLAAKEEQLKRVASAIMAERAKKS